MDLRRPCARGIQGFFEDAVIDTAANQDPIQLLTVRALGKLMDIGLGVAGGGEHGGGGRENEPLGIERERSTAITKEHPPIGRHTGPSISRVQVSQRSGFCVSGVLQHDIKASLNSILG